MLTDLASGETLLQLAVIALMLVAAWLSAVLVKRWRVRHAPLAVGARARVAEIALIEAPIVIALLTLLIERTVVAAFGYATTLLDIAMQLVSVLILVRLGAYLLRLALGPVSWMRTWETRLTIVIWLAISFELVGWLEAIERTLDRINLAAA